jgi:hypothetical protein
MDRKRGVLYFKGNDTKKEEPWTFTLTYHKALSLTYQWSSESCQDTHATAYLETWPKPLSQSKIKEKSLKIRIQRTECYHQGTSFHSYQQRLSCTKEHLFTTQKGWAGDAQSTEQAKKENWQTQ